MSVQTDQQIKTFTLENENGAKAIITNYGAKLMSLYVPNTKGELIDVVTGYDTAEEYLEGDPYFGATVGRFANRIAKGKFTLDGVDYTLACNNGPNALHGGPDGFSQKIWDAELNEEDNTLTLSYFSEDMEEGYPGNLDMILVYTLTEDNELVLEYQGNTDKATVLNMTHHSFFNLKGEGEGDILDHELQVNATHFTPSDDTAIPTGEILPVEGTPFDFTEFHTIGERIESDHQQIVWGAGYDHNYVLGNDTGNLKHAATLVEPKGGIVMDVFTTEPGMQLYTGNFLGGDDKGKNGRGYIRRGAVCLETQNYPDAPNKENFPNSVLRPGDTYLSMTIYGFSTLAEDQE